MFPLITSPNQGRITSAVFELLLAVNEGTAPFS